MHYQLTTANEVIARVDNNFDIDYSDWITRAPLWISDALSELRLVQAYEETSIDLDVVNYHVELPNISQYDIRRILAVVYNDELLTRLKIINPARQPKILEGLNRSSETYTIKNGHIVTSFDEGTITLYFDRPALEYDVKQMVYLPKIPNNDLVKIAIEWYLMYCILRKGHRHPLYSLDSNNPLTNPYSMWDTYKKKARNSMGSCDPEEREELSRLIKTFVLSKDSPINYIEL